MKPSSSRRVASVDAFRGIAIAAMILVNNPGSWEYGYPPLRHAEWHGWTPTDLIFPFFLFVVGVSISLSLSKRIGRKPPPADIYVKIIRRTIILFGLGLFLRLYPYFDTTEMRIPGVLQRIALCYLLSSLLYLKTSPKVRTVLAFGIIVFYWALLEFVPVPGYGAGVLERQGNLCGYIDVRLLGGHLYTPDFDPEGLLSTIPAVATTLFGTLVGDWLRSGRASGGKILGIGFAGVCLTLAGLLLHPFFPINKPLWTSTYVLFTAGAAMVVLALIFGIMEGRKKKTWASPFLIYGSNAIFAYVGTTLMAETLAMVRIDTGEGVLPIKTIIYQQGLVPWAGNMAGTR